MTLPTLEAIGKATLKNLSTPAAPDVAGRSLWESSAAVVVAFRRPGCVLCREEARKIWGLKEQFDKLGINLVGLVHENIPEQIAEFHPDFWPGQLYLDTDKDFYKALGNGKVVRGSAAQLINPFGQAWKAIARAKKTITQHNLKGDGLTMGGLFVVKQGDGGVQFMHLEKTFGDHASSAEVLEAAQQAVQA